jgi:hypothetical protein
VYGDECYLRVYDGGTGAVIFSAPAANGTGFEQPTIADVDGDFALRGEHGRTMPASRAAGMVPAPGGQIHGSGALLS